MDYSFKRGFKPDLERIQKALEEEFPSEIKQEDGKLLLSFGALKSICVSINGKKLTVTTESVIGADDVVAMDTNKRFRNFLEKATGYNAKQRLQIKDNSFKRGFKPDLERIQKALEEEFPSEIKQEDGKLLLSYGALKSICVSITGKKLTVTTESVIGADDVVAMDTNKRFRNFLEKATGYNAKQRLQMAKKEVTKGAD